MHTSHYMYVLIYTLYHWPTSPTMSPENDIYNQIYIPNMVYVFRYALVYTHCVRYEVEKKLSDIGGTSKEYRHGREF